MKIDREVDLRGEICPYTFVKSKLALEEVNVGDILKVKIDYPMAAENVPRSMENEGQEVLEVKEVDESEWEIILKRKK